MSLQRIQHPGPCATARLNCHRREHAPPAPDGSDRPVPPPVPRRPNASDGEPPLSRSSRSLSAALHPRASEGGVEQRPASSSIRCRPAHGRPSAQLSVQEGPGPDQASPVSGSLSGPAPARTPKPRSEHRVCGTAPRLRRRPRPPRQQAGRATT